MALKTIIFIMLSAVLKLICGPFSKSDQIATTPIDKTWWNNLNDEWKTIFLINQSFSKHGINIFAIQNEYINRLNSAGEEAYSELNRSLHDLNEEKRFGLGYTDFYARVLRKNPLIKDDSIDLSTLADLDTLYMVNGPGDLTPLKKIPGLKVLVINYCGIDNNLPLNKQVLDLEPLRYLKQLEVLHCSSVALKSLEPIKDLVNLRELYCDNSSVISLDPLKNLVNLKKLSFGSKVNNASIVSRLENLEELYTNGCKQIPDLARLQKLRSLCISEDELAIVKADYRITDLGFLKNLKTLEYLDLKHTSYRNDLNALSGLQNLKAITLPSVGRSEMTTFKKIHKNCLVLNSFEFE